MRAAFVVALREPKALRALNFSAAVEAMKRRGRGTYTPLRDLAESMGKAYRTAFIRRDADRSVGVELLSQSDLFAAETAGRIIRYDSFQYPEDHAIQKWQLLIAGVGTLGETELYGRSILADTRLLGKYMCEDIFAVTFKEPASDPSLFASAFLSTRVGIGAIRATSYGTKTLKLRRDLLDELPIPRAAPAIESKVAALMRRAVEQRELYASEVKSAREIINMLPEMGEAHTMCAERRARAVVWGGKLETLGAWNYASTGGASELLACRSRARVGDIVPADGIFRGGRYARIGCSSPFGVEMLSQRDAFLIRPIPRRIVRPAASDRELFVQPGTLVLAGAGTLGEGEIFGRTMYVSRLFAGRACTELLLRVQPQKGSAESLYAFLTTLVGLRLVRATVHGSKLVYMRPDLMRRLPMPELSSEVRSVVRDKIITAFNAKDAAAEAESEAIRIIEEEVLPAWLA